MRIKGSIAKSFLLALAISLIPAVAISAQKVTPGSTCKVYKQKVTNQNKVYTCIRSGKKLVWNRGLVAKQIPNPRPLQTSSDTPLSSSNLSLTSELKFSSAENCRLAKPENLPMDDGNSGSVGFPRKSDALASIGTAKGLLLFVDFPDVKAEENFQSNFTDWQIPLAENFFKSSSYGKFNLKISQSQSVYHLTNLTTAYNLLQAPGGGPYPGLPVKLNDLLYDAMSAADNEIDFSVYSFVSVVLPLSQKLTLGGVFGVPPTSTEKYDGARFTFASVIPLDGILPKSDFSKSWNWVHDIGHMLGLMHPYRMGVRNAWDVMNNYSSQPDFLGWNKWKLDWIRNQQVLCLADKPSEEFIIKLTPVGGSEDGKKLLAIRISSTREIIVEVRRGTPFDKSVLLPDQEGVLVYQVDTTKVGDTRSLYSGAFEILSNLNKEIFFPASPSNILGTMKPGDSILTDGLRISILNSDKSGEFISIKSAN